jgi:hypothetical protein
VAELIPENFGALTLVNQSRADEIDQLLRERNWTVWRLDGTEASDAPAVFAQAARDLPSPFSIRPVADWTQFQDSLWEAAHTTKGTDIVLLWSGVDKLLAGALSDLVQAAIALTGVSRGLNDPAPPRTPRKQFRTVLLGDGPNFPPDPGRQ